MRRLILGTAVAIMGYSMFAKVVVGLLIHFLTIYIAFDVSGFFAALLTFFFPFLSQIYWAFRIWTETGFFFNILTLAIIFYGLLWLIIIGAGSIAIAAED